MRLRGLGGTLGSLPGGILNPNGLMEGSRIHRVRLGGSPGEAQRARGYSGTLRDPTGENPEPKWPAGRLPGYLGTPPGRILNPNGLLERSGVSRDPVEKSSKFKRAARHDNVYWKDYNPELNRIFNTLLTSDAQIANTNGLVWEKFARMGI